MSYEIKFLPIFEKQIMKIAKKDKILFERIIKKLEEVSDNPEHYKPLKGNMKGIRRVHFDPFVILFYIDGNMIKVSTIKHHDEAY